VTISHHLAHAYSTIGTCPFDEFNVLVIDGCGSPYDECFDLNGAVIPEQHLILPVPHLYCEKDSYYTYRNNRASSLYKDFSEMGHHGETYRIAPHTTKHTIGGLYGAVSLYCFTNVDDAGKLMGLGPYGRAKIHQDQIFDLRDGRVFVKYNWMPRFGKPARTFAEFAKNFQYYADIAYWVQREIERAIIYLVNSRLKMADGENLCLAGGVALNAVANARILSSTNVKNLYIEPAAGDNGLSIGCAYYGWLEVLKKERVRHNGSTCFGMPYPNDTIGKSIDAHSEAIDSFFQILARNYTPATFSAGDRCLRFDFGNGHKPYNLIVKSNGVLEYNNSPGAKPNCLIALDKSSFYQVIFRPEYWVEILKSNRVRISNPVEFEVLLKMLNMEALSKTLLSHIKTVISAAKTVKAKPASDYIKKTAALLAEGKIVGWFQDGSEFGPRALGRRSILADPRNSKTRSFINSEIKFREDFRPFAPSVLREDVSLYFNTDRESPYMILVDQVRPEWRDKLKSVVHEDDSCRIQTVTPDWNPKFYELLQEFKRITGISVLLNTSFNRRGMPIVETPDEALQFFYSCRLDCLTIHDYVVEK